MLHAVFVIFILAAIFALFGGVPGALAVVMLLLVGHSL
jgi:hypothetical protein